MIEEALKKVFNDNSDEYQTITETYKLIVSSSPTINSESKTLMILADIDKVKLASIYFLLQQKISSIKKQYQQTYDNHYIRLVKLGRPSHVAIDTEIRSVYPDYVILSKQVEDLEQVKELVGMYIKAIDSLKQTAIEMLRDSRRID
jgi:hypothetical protein